LRSLTKMITVAALVVGLSTVAAPAQAATDDTDARPGCDVGYQFDPSSSTLSIKGVDTAVARNIGSRPIGYKFTSHKSGTMGWSASVTLSAEIQVAVFAAVKAEVNAGISKSVTASIGVEVTGTVPPHSTVQGTYGVFYVRVHGQKYWQTRECRKQQVAWISVTAPYGRGWQV